MTDETTTMRIGLVSSTQQTCPPIGYGSEAATADLAVALEKLGHTVTLFAPQGSMEPSGGLCKLPFSHPKAAWDTRQHDEAFAVRSHREAAAALDVIHDFTLSFGAHGAACEAFECGRKGPAHLCTLNGIGYLHPAAPFDHNHVVVSEASKAHADGRGAWYNTPYPQDHTGELPLKGQLAHVVRYGRDETVYAPVDADDVEDYILYVGRPHPAKGIDLILDVAQMWTDQRFVLAWRASLPDHKLYEAQYLARIKKLDNVEFQELPDDACHESAKVALMARASALLHPNIYIDACPVVPIEAQLCGTPCVGWSDRGGFIENVTQATAVLRPMPRGYWNRRSETADILKRMCRDAFDLSREDVRAHALADLTSKRMAEDYVRVYEAIIADAKEKAA